MTMKRSEAAVAQFATIPETKALDQLIMLLAGVLILACLLLLGGCANVSKGVAKDGSHAEQLVWPAPGDVTPMHKGGTFPLIPNLQSLHEGMNKQQISDLIGYPHFEEGVWGVREWNYVFNFRDAQTGQVTVCQFKILFDKDKLARSFYWKPEACADYMKPPAPAPVAAETKAPVEEMTLSADALFAFDKSSAADITDGGRAQLSRLADKLVAEKDRITHIEVLGYTDRLGGDAYNQALSQRRAETVAQYLAAHGVPEDVMHAEGRGKSEPVVQCSEQARGKLIACLAPNRRVVVQVK